MFSLSRVARGNVRASAQVRLATNDNQLRENAIKGFGARSDRFVWEGPAYDLNPAQQEAFKDLISVQKQNYGPLLSKYPELQGLISQMNNVFSQAVADSSQPIRVAVSGAAGQIGYALLYRIASGGVFGPQTPVILHLLELPTAQGALKGVEMELLDCAFPTLSGIVVTSDPKVAFEGVDYALLVGGFPRSKDMERRDLLLKNADIFSTQGKALNSVGKGKDTRVLVVGNPANTNAMIASRNAPSIPAENFSAMTRLDHNRGISQIVTKTGCAVEDIEKFAIWGNHSTTQFPNLGHATIKGQPALDVIGDDAWYKKDFTPLVQKRGAAVIAARGSSSAASAASSLIDAVRDWHFGTAPHWTSAAVVSNGEYGVEKGLFFSYPVVFSERKWSIVKDLPLDEYSQQMIDTTTKELKGERDDVAKYLP